MKTIKEAMGQLIVKNTKGYGVSNPHYSKPRKKSLGTPFFKDSQPKKKKKKKPVIVSRAFKISDDTKEEL